MKKDELTKENIQKRVLQNGEQLSLDKFLWDEKSRTFSSVEDNLVLDFSDLNNCTFDTGSNCTFKTGSNCTFKTNYNCTFKTGSNCTFKTNYNCTFKTGSNCTFKTDSYCTFKTNYNCTFDTGSYCTFDTDYNCTFNTSSDCIFNTSSDCTFKTSSDCTFDTVSYCIFNTSSDCTFKTSSDCTFKTSSDCTFKTSSDCTFDTGSYCTFKTSYNCTFGTSFNCTFKTDYDCTFKTDSYCIFNTSYDCTFDTGSYCTFDTGSYCTFNTSSDCIFNTSSDCTFKTGSECVVVRRDIFEVILLKENIQTKLCPYKIKGYLEEHDSKWYLNGNIEDVEYIIVDNILSKVLKRKGNVLKVINHSDTEESYIVEHNGYYSHGRTLVEARESLVYKLSTRDLTEFKSLTLESVLSRDEAIRMYMSVTGACAFGTKQFIESRDIKEEYSIKEIINLTISQYGNEKLKEFFSFN